MNLQWLASPEWALIVKALLHTLWQGAIIAVLLGLALRRVENPVTRYRSSLAALASVVIAGMITWAWFNLPAPQKNSDSPAPIAATEPAPVVEKNELPPIVVTVTAPAPKPATLGWTAWMAFAWLIGATLMIGRAGFQVAGAERLRRASQPLDDAHIAELLAEARKAVGLARRVRIAVTDKLTSPAIVGVLVPTLILPLSLTSTLSPEQIRFILLHELAHIRRGDYFANLFQLFAEALLFFNPAVWWISRQMRIEREACCDALAIELSGAPADYARTLVHVAENVLQTAPTAALAFGDEREPSSLADRVQRLLVPGYRPRLRLTWRAMLASLCVGGALLVLSALGTRVTVAAILSPQQRIERIEKRMTELGEKPGVEADRDSSDRVTVVAHVRTVDNTPLHKERSATIHSESRHSSGYYSAWVSKEGWATNKVQAGEIWVEANAKGYAPTIVGPFNGKTTNFVDAGEIVLDKGFEVQLHVSDANTGTAITNAFLQASLEHMATRHSFQSPRKLKTGADGKVTMPFCIAQNLNVTISAPGYEITSKSFEKISANQTLEIKLRPGSIATGRVMDKMTGKGIAGAEMRVVVEKDDVTRDHEWTDKMYQLATTDADGRFVINQLRFGTRYWLGVSAPGHESAILKPFIASSPRELSVELGPELIVRGRVIGNLDGLQIINQDHTLDVNWTDRFDNSSYGHNKWAVIRQTNGTVTFEFTNRVAGKVTLSGLNGYREEREVTAPIDDWVVDLSSLENRSRPAKQLSKREVIFRFKHSSGVAPRGTVRVKIPSDEDPRHSAVSQIMAITNGEVRAKIPFGYSTDIEPERMVGYMFNRTGEWRSPTGERGDWMSIEVGSNAAPLVIEIPLLPAGAIYARAKNADGTAAGGLLLFGVTELKKAPGRDHNGLNDHDGFSGNAPRQWVSGALPLGGTYQIHAWRGNSFCISKPVKLTEANPDAEVELQFPPGKTFNGIVLGPDGQPLREVEMKANFSLADNHGFGLKNVFADERGHFQLTDTTPELGTYSVDISAPGIQAETVKLDFKIQPQVIRLKRGRTLAGCVIDDASGQPIPGMKIRTGDYEKNNLPQQETETDDNGRFTFTTLGDGNYAFYPNDGSLVARSNPRFRADGSTNIVLRVKLYEWSKVKPKGVVTNVQTTIAGTNYLWNQPRPDVQFTTTVTNELKQTNPPALITRTYKVNTNTFLRNLGVPSTTNRVKIYSNGSGENIMMQKALSQEVAQRTYSLLTNAGVDLNPALGKKLFYNYEAGILTVRAPESDQDFVDYTLQSLSIPSQIQTNFNESEQITNPPTLISRTFKVDTNHFYAALEQTQKNSGSTNLSIAVHNFFENLGIDLASPGKLVFYQDSRGWLTVTATAAELEYVERAIAAINHPLFGKTKPDLDVVNRTVSRFHQATPSQNHPAQSPVENILTRTFKLDGTVREEKLKKALLDAGVEMPPTVFIYTDGGIFLVRASEKQMALVNKALMKLSGASEKEIEAVSHQPTQKLSTAANAADTNLFNRSYKLTAQAFQAALKKTRLKSGETNASLAIRSFFTGMGVDLEKSPGKTAFYSDVSGGLIVRATAADLEVVERIIETLNYTPPQLHIKARFIEVTQTKSSSDKSLESYLGAFKINETNLISARITNSASVSGLIDDLYLQGALQAIRSGDGIRALAEPELVTSSGRQCKLMMGQTISVITNFMVEEDPTNHATAITPQVSQLETGIALDVVPQVLADGCAIQLALKPSWIEFLGYAQTNSRTFQTATGKRLDIPGIHPLIRTQEVASTVTLWDGQTAVLGGIVSERRVKKEMPVVGLIPLFGKLFEKQETVKVNNFVFVTATIVDPAGNRVHSDAELEAMAAKQPVPSQPK